MKAEERYDAAAGVRPRLRGVLHRYAAIVFALGFAVLVARAPNGAARTWVAIHALCITTMLTVSAVYHSGRLDPAAARRVRRLDHCTILLAIAGSYTGIIGLGLDGPARLLLLTVVWVGAIAGIAIRMLWLDAPHSLVAAVYLVVGWAALVDLPAITAALTGPQLAFVLAGGLLYTAGGIVYAWRRPDPWPLVFGYHEVFHAVVVVAAACHLLAVALVLG